MQIKRTGRILAATSLSAALVVAGIAAPAVAGNNHGSTSSSSSSSLRKAVKAKNIVKHLDAFQRIADANGGNRAAGTSGHVASAEYVEKKLKAAGYTTTRQPFSYTKVIVDVAALSQAAPTAIDYTYPDGFYPMDYTGQGDVTATVTPVDVNLEGDRASTSGCEAEDFATFPAGNVALIQRGSCDFAVKAGNAAAAGAAAVVIFNQGNDVPGDDRFGVVQGTLGAPGTLIPVVGTTFAIGETFVNTPDASARVALQTHDETVNTFNVLADTKKGNPAELVVVGGHLDGVAEGPGINDNGSGTASILETAIQFAELKIKPKNQIRFAFWSGEEDGLQGSNFYVSQLTEQQVTDHALNLNFDMVGSPNAVRFVYDGDGDALGTAGPEGSDEIEDIFLDYFASQGLATAPTDFDGRSDYFAFIEAGIPAGGLFTGAEGIKTEDEAAIFGGTAGEPYDPCYHSACDTSANIDPVVLEQMADAIAHATFVASDAKVRGHGHGHGHGHGSGNGHGHGGHGPGHHGHHNKR